MSNTKKMQLGVQVARLVVRGLVGEARALAGSRTSWSVSEARALIGACRFAQTKLGAPASVNFSSFCGAS
jgi:hypothetical protein